MEEGKVVAAIGEGKDKAGGIRAADPQSGLEEEAAAMETPARGKLAKERGRGRRWRSEGGWRSAADWGREDDREGCQMRRAGGRGVEKSKIIKNVIVDLGLRYKVGIVAEDYGIG